jgi:hypothetical protein
MSNARRNTDLSTRLVGRRNPPNNENAPWLNCGGGDERITVPEVPHKRLMTALF